MSKISIVILVMLYNVYVNEALGGSPSLDMFINGRVITDMSIQFSSSESIEPSIDLLIHHISAAFNVRLTKNPLVDDKHTIIICDASSGGYLEHDQADLENIHHDGFRLTIGPGAMVRIEAVEVLGLINGLTELMEQLEFRFYMPGPYGTVYPDRNVNLNPTVILSNPAFVYRCIGTGPWSLLAYRANVNLDVPGLSFGRRIWGQFHTFGFLLPEGEYFPSHPEYYARRTLPLSGTAGVLQLATDNPQVIEIVAQKMVQLSKSEKYQVLTLSPSDHRKFDFSFSVEHFAELLRPHDQMLSKRMFSFYNQVAKRYAELGGDTPIRIGAYDIYTAPPEENDVPLNRLLIPYVAHFDYCQLHSIQDVDCQVNSRFFAILNKWTHMSGKFHIYEYTYKHNWLELPWPVYVNTVNNVQGFFELGAKGFHAQFSEANTFPNLLNYYITAKALWNPSIDYEKVRKEFFERFYKETSTYMEKSYEVLENEFRRHPFHVSGHAENNFLRVFSKGSLESARTMVDEALAQVSDPIVKERVSMMRLWLEYALSMRSLIGGDYSECGVKSIMGMIETARKRGWPIFEEKNLFKSHLMNKFLPQGLAANLAPTVFPSQEK
jgi:hypothetical protein